MVRKTRIAAILLTAVFVGSLLAPVGAFAGTQSNKNTWRNLGIGSAAVGAYGLLNHNTGLGLLGVAGAAYSANRYEHERHAQSVHRQKRAYRHRKAARHY